MNFAHREKGGADFLGDHFLAVFAFEAKGFFVIGDSFVEGFHGDAQMIDFLNHIL